MKRTGMFLVMLLMPWAWVRGEPVDQRRAEEAAYAFISAYYPKKTTFGIAEILPVRQSGEIVLYVVNLSPEGWVLLSADDRVLPVIGFSFSGRYDLNYGQFPAVDAWVSAYGSDIHQVKKSRSMPVNRLWDYPAGEYKLKSTASDIDPFIPVNWDQDGGWNIYCPEDPEGPGGHVYVGCVAVAMSQAMSVYKYPAQGTGTSSYNHDVYGSLVVQYDNAPVYQWDSMALTLSDKYNARLLYHAAVAVKMDFGPESSGSTVVKLSGALATYFKYYKGAKRLQRYEDDDAWRALLVEELSQGRPIVYAGNADDGEPGHAFNIDGVMNGKYFHLNWGWSGRYNGYYVIDNLNPSSFDFFANHEAVINIRPPIYGPTDLDLTKKTVKERMPAGTYVGRLKITDEATDNTYEVVVKGDSLGENEYSNADFYLSNDSLLTSREFQFNERNEYAIYIVVTDQFNHVYQEKFTIGILQNAVVSDIGNQSTSFVDIYPNPSTGWIVFKAAEEGTWQLEIIDAQGKTVYHAVHIISGQPVGLRRVSPGAYLLRMISPSGKLIVKRLIIN